MKQNEPDFQQYLLRGLLEHPSFVSYTEPEFFSADPVYVEFLQSLTYFLHKYSKTPDVIEMKRFISEQGNQATIMRTLEITERIYSLPEPSDFTLEKLGDHVRYTMTKRLGFQIADFVQTNNSFSMTETQTKMFVSHVDKLANLKYQPQAESPEFFAGFKDYVYKLNPDDTKVIPTLIPLLDNYVRVEPSTLNVILGGTGVGKSTILCNFAAGALAQSYKVHYVSLEMSKEQIEGRIYQRMTGLTWEDIAYDKELSIFVWEGESWGTERTEDGLPLYHIPRKRFFEKGKLEVSFFPTATILTIREELRRIEKLRGWKPDLLIVDYGDLLTPVSNNSRERRHQLETAFIELRQFACEEKVALWSASQLNKVGATSKFPNVSDIAEGWAKVWVMDNALILAEDKDNENAFILKGGKVRNGKKDFMIRLQTQLDIMLVKQHENQVFGDDGEENEKGKSRKGKKDEKQGVFMVKIGDKWCPDLSRIPIADRTSVLAEFNKDFAHLSGNNGTGHNLSDYDDGSEKPPF